MKRTLLLLLFCFTPLLAMSQSRETFKNQYSVGLGAGIGSYFDHAFDRGGCEAFFMVQPQLLLEGQFTQRSGVTLGVGYTNYSKALSIPLMYKFYSNVLDVAVGAELLLPMGNKYYGGANVNPETQKVESYRVPYKPFDTGYGAKVRLSKCFEIAHSWGIEPFMSMSMTKYNDGSRLDNSLDLSVGFIFKLGL